MNKTETAIKVAYKCGLSYALTYDILSGFLDEINEALMSRQGVSIDHLGRFEVKTRQPRYYNLFNDPETKVAPKRDVVCFTASAKLRKRTQG